jgi:ubiquitin C-terminal hydrolase
MTVQINNNAVPKSPQTSNSEGTIRSEQRKLQVNELVRKIDIHNKSETDLKIIDRPKNYSLIHNNQGRYASQTYKHTSYIDANGKVIEKKELEKKIIDKIRGIYSADSITVNDVLYSFGGETEIINGVRREKKREARQIIIQRTWGLIDLKAAALIPFFSSLFKTNSGYRKEIQSETIRNFLLDAKISDRKEDLDLIFNSTKEIMVKANRNIRDSDLEEFRKIAEQMYKEKDEIKITNDYEKGKDPLFISNLKLFAKHYTQQYNLLLDSGKNQLEYAYMQCKSIKMYLPTDLFDPDDGRQLSAYIEPPENSICMTRLQIFLGAGLREITVTGFKKITGVFSKNNTQPSDQKNYQPRNTKIEIFEEQNDSVISESQSDVSQVWEVLHDPIVANPYSFKIKKGPMGIKNIVNSCYMSASLQMLLNIPEIRQLIKTSKDKNDITKELYNLKKARESLDQSGLILHKLRQAVFKKADLAFFNIEGKPGATKQEREESQHDAQEFLIFILDQIGWNPITSVAHVKVDKKEYDRVPEKTSLIHLNMKEKSFQKALNKYFSEEKFISDDKTPQLDHDGVKYKQWSITNRFEALPKDLIIHLADRKRNLVAFEFPADGNVTIPHGNAHAVYEITGYVNHEGKNVKYGHYTAYIKNCRDEKGKERWVYCDDGLVEIGAPKNVENNAYIVLLKLSEG